MKNTLNISNIKEKLKEKYLEIKPKIIEFYTGPDKKKAITVTAVGAASVLLIGGIGVHALLDKDSNAKSVYAETELKETTTLLEATETDALLESTTVVETTTIQETTVMPEPTSIVEDTGTSAIIPISQLTISSEDLSNDKEVINRVQANQAPALSGSLSDITAGTSFTANTGFTTGVDVSKYQGDINWTSAKNDGIDFAFVKVAGRGYETGTLYYDNKYKYNLKNAAAAGIKVGAYFFSQATTVREAQEEASMIVDALKGYTITYPVVFDWETAAGYRTNSGISKDTMTAMANAFCSIVEASGYKAMVYANTFDFERFHASTLTANYSSWLARYPSNYNGNGLRFKTGDGLPSLSYPYQIWQYSSTGRVNGIPGDVDMNVSFVNFSKTGTPGVPITFELPATEYTTSVGSMIDVLSNVKCFNCAGLNETQNMKCTIKNVSGTTVTINDAIATAGKYTVTYSLKDFTGYTGSKSVALYVKTAPSITLSTDTITLAATDGYDACISMIQGNVLSATDFTGKNILSKISITYPANFFMEEYETESENSSEIIFESASMYNEAAETTKAQETGAPSETTAASSEDTTAVSETTPAELETSETTTEAVVPVKKLISGTYAITYSITDDFGLSAAKSINLVITD